MLLLFSSETRSPNDIEEIRGLCLAEPIDISGSYLEVWRRRTGAEDVRVRNW